MVGQPQGRIARGRSGGLSPLVRLSPLSVLVLSVMWQGTVAVSDYCLAYEICGGEKAAYQFIRIYAIRTATSVVLMLAWLFLIVFLGLESANKFLRESSTASCTRPCLSSTPHHPAGSSAGYVRLEPLFIPCECLPVSDIPHLLGITGPENS